MSLSKHTQLINRIMGLCNDTSCWPHILHDLGYTVQLIEQTISLQKTAQKITPDVIVVSDRLVHAMVIDCKGGTNIDSDQDRRYESLEPRDLVYYITVHDRNRLTHVACYADETTNHEFLEPYTKLPFITFGSDEISGIRDFGKKEVNNKLCRRISLTGMLEPTGYYPFSPDDRDSAIISHILSGLLAYLIQRGRKSPSTVVDSIMAEEIFKITHPFHEQISSRHRKRLIRRIKLMIDVCKNSSSEFKQQLAKIENGKDGQATMQSLRRICKKLIDKYTQQKLIDSF